MVSGITTLKKSKMETPVIRSSSTWNGDQLDMFKVHPAEDVDAKAMIPEKWFDFSGLERYESSTSSFGFAHCSLH